ncbi:MAG: PfkB family carbohydrate kinase [Planctomycetota bacterium]
MAVAVCGSIAIDTIENRYGKVENLLGGSASYFSLASAFFTKTYIFSCIGKDLEERLFNLLKKNENIVTKYIKVSDKFSNFRWHGRYSYDFERVETVEAEYKILSEDVLAQKIEDKFDIIFLANTDPVIQSRMADFFRDSRLIFCDTMNHWIATKRKELESLLTKVYGIFVNEEEAKLLSGEATSLEAANKIRDKGPKIVIIKKGEDGSLINYQGKIVMYSGYPVRKLMDTTGAGDSFAGAFLGYLAKSKENLSIELVKKAAIWGNVVASFTCEGMGPTKLLSIKKEDIDKRFQEYLEQLRI